MSMQQGAWCIRFLALFALMYGVTGSPRCFSGENVIPKGEYAKIDMRACNETINALKSEDSPAQQAAVARVLAAPHRYPPIVLCVMADLLFDKGKVDEASFWFYAGMLRIRFDAKRCADVSAREAVTTIDRQYGRNISRYAAQDPKNFEALVAQVVAWDRRTPYEYDHRWINLHGMNAMLPSMAGAPAQGKPQPMSLPKEQWDELAEKNRFEYIGDIRGALNSADSAASNTTAQAR